MPIRPHDPTVVGLVLAAGRASRMGCPKQLLPLGERPLLRHVIDATCTARTLAGVVVVLGHAADEIRAAVGIPERGVEAVVNPHHRDGQSSSLAVGLAAMPAHAIAAAVLLGDQPGLTATRIDEIVSAFLTGRTPIVRPVHRDGAPGHPVLLGRSVWPAVAGLRGDEGARTLIAHHPALVTLVPCRDDAPTDVDTVRDYERVRASTLH